MVNNQWSPGLSSADVNETKAGTGVSLQLTVHVKQLEGSLLDFVGGSLSRETLGQVALVAVDNYGKPVSASTIGKARVQEIHLPALDAATKASLMFSVKFFQAMESDAAVPTTVAPTTVQQAQAMLASNFKFETDVPWTTAFSVDSMVLTSAGATTWTLPTLAVVVRADTSTVNPLKRWMASGLPKEGTLTLLSPNLMTPMLVERFAGLRVQSINSVPEPANVIQRVKVTMTMTAMRVGSSTATLK